MNRALAFASMLPNVHAGRERNDKPVFQLRGNFSNNVGDHSRFHAEQNGFRFLHDLCVLCRHGDASFALQFLARLGERFARDDFAGWTKFRAHETAND